MLTFREVAIPVLQDGEILVQVTCCTVCGSDLHTYSGRRDCPTPSILGHEIVGTVADVGGTNTCDIAGGPLKIGDRITWSLVASCGNCHKCRTGIPQKCESLFKYGHEPLATEHGPNGGLAEYCLLRPGTAIMQIPKGLTDNVICPASCATATVAAAVRTAGSLEQKRVLIMGAGMLGLTASAFAVTMRSATVCVWDVDESRLRRAQQFGATTMTPVEASPVKYDVVFEMSGNSQAVAASIDSVAIGGTVVLVGSVLPTRKVSIDPEQIVRRLISIHGVHNYRPDDLETAVRFLADHHSNFPFAKLVERTFSLDEAADAFTYAEQNRPIRVAVVP